MLSTVAASAASKFAASNPHLHQVAAHAAVHGYTTGFAWAAVIFTIGALIVGVLYTPQRHKTPAAQANSIVPRKDNDLISAAAGAS